MTLDEYCEELDVELLRADGLDTCIIGVTTKSPMRVVYDAEKIAALLVKRDGMTEEEAWEWFDFNIDGAYVGEQTPIYIMPITFSDPKPAPSPSPDSEGK